MKKFLSSFVLAIFTAVTVFPGCGDVGVVGNTGKADPEIESAVRESPELQRLLAIRNDMIMRAVRSAVTGWELRNAHAAGDLDRFGARLGYSAGQLQALSAELVDLAEALYERYPELREASAGSGGVCPPCDASLIAERWDRYRNACRRIPADGDQTQLPAPDPSHKGVHCYWLRYAAALVACALSGNPLIYFVCAYLALCAYCGGGWIDSFCGN